MGEICFCTTSLKAPTYLWCKRKAAHLQNMSKGVYQKENLVHHMKVIHTQEKNKLQCNWCGKTYQSEHSYKNHYKSNCIKRYEKGEEITPQIMLEAEMMVRAQAQSLIQGLSTPFQQCFQRGWRGLSQKNQKMVLWS